MPKTAKLRKTKASNSIRSRAARRATSPSLNVEKSLLNIPAPEDVDSIPLTAKEKLDKAISEISMRAPGQEPGRGYAGVGKKSKRGTKLTSKQRRRREKGTVMAERVASRFEKKVQESVGRSKVAVSRKGAWDELNSKIEAPVDAAASMVVEMKISRGDYDT